MKCEAAAERKHLGRATENGPAAFLAAEVADICNSE
jgi:hypothetical protein